MTWLEKIAHWFVGKKEELVTGTCRACGEKIEYRSGGVPICKVCIGIIDARESRAFCVPGRVEHVSPEPPLPPKEEIAAKGTWRSFEAKRLAVQELAKAQGGPNFFTSASFVKPISGDYGKVIVSKLVAGSTDDEIKLVVSDKLSIENGVVLLNHDEALALYRGLKPLFDGEGSAVPSGDSEIKKEGVA
jgi:hypothetical protein